MKIFKIRAIKRFLLSKEILLGLQPLLDYTNLLFLFSPCCYLFSKMSGQNGIQIRHLVTKIKLAGPFLTSRHCLLSTPILRAQTPQYLHGKFTPQGNVKIF